ncbi:MAG: M23 family metallopeptidase [Planctomycetota bacterium]|nr:M23 family metallopeptidase [Planctomycetota bacterium]MDI6787854.1 M23 family metallopeptidase [Planctomycetota bacterium]
MTRYLISLALLTLLSTGCGGTSLYLSNDEEARLNKEIKDILLGKEDKTNRLSSIVSELGFISPLEGKILERLGTDGIKIKAYHGQPVKAVKSGIVTFISDNMAGYGKVVTVKHPDGFLSFYAYNSEILVKVDDVVKQGDVIAKAGSTGRATQPQLFFRLFKDDTPVNPSNYLP